MSLKLESDVIFYYKRLLAQDVAKAEPLLQKTACMNLQERMSYGALEIVKETLKLRPSAELNDLLDFLQKIIQINGQMKWQKGELTHLALKVGSPVKESSYFKKPKKSRISSSSSPE